MTRHVAVVSAGLGVPSSTRLLADRLDSTARRTAAITGAWVALADDLPRR